MKENRTELGFTTPEISFAEKNITAYRNLEITE